MLTEPEGTAMIRRALDLFSDRMFADASLARWFAGVDTARLRRHQREFLLAALTGGELERLPDLAPAHHPLGIDGAAFDRSLDHLEDSLREVGMDAVAASAIRARLTRFRSRIVA